MSMYATMNRHSERELELGNSSEDSEGSNSESSASNSESASDEESQNSMSENRRRGFAIASALAISGLAILGYNGVLETSELSAIPPTGANFGVAPASSTPSMPDDREALMVTPNASSLEPDTLASPYAPKPLIPIKQLAENKRRRPTSVKPKEGLHDGNVCDGTEELYAGLCYTKCSILTGFPEARRSTAFSCCPTSHCHRNVFKMKTASLIPCQGYDVSSSDGGTACPHIRGECLTDEEQFLGECFEKCSILTNGRFPLRVGAASCCVPKGKGGCFNIFENDYTNAKLNVGGGQGDGDVSTPRASHFPLKYLTELN